MDSIIGFHEQMEFGETPEKQLARYRACLNAFEQMQYSDNYILQIKEDISKLEKLIASRSEVNS
ncbi:MULTISPECIES: hypothetical protein [Shewanella]|uniref:Phage protein n=1 Tax=Shewanella fidelis TaxID=173509 RepID=A0AAW8NW86_9GAMM|nr:MULTISPECIES: hypothetical protein [Shewanella]MDR8525738.1 hypothetical protein [Shewanella fidelis]MDW4812753.1 hypothetical protein [Shewanella fidelis]MDW4816501.1 hypothetical protein [Shewanella fidelis]MDW4820335.1 hypothetical protein [Shewanella fidelis]MDW4825217.1 hypothetical protein [Shewanella fidelis]